MAARLIRCVLVGTVVALNGASGVAQTPEYDVKAAYLFNFVNFTQWPPHVFENPASPLRICIVAPDPFGDTIDDAVRGEAVLGHPLHVERLGGGDRVASCHVVFVPASAAPAGILRAAADAPVLTVGESEAFWRAGGMLRFFLDGRTVRFDANAKAAEAAGLRLSARLLQVARSTTSTRDVR